MPADDESSCAARVDISELGSVGLVEAVRSIMLSGARRGVAEEDVSVTATRASSLVACGVEVLCPTSAVVVPVRIAEGGGGRFGHRLD